MSVPTWKQRVDWALEYGHSVDDLLNRRTGKSLADALSTIASAIQNPGKLVKIEDHTKDRHVALKSTLFYIKDIITKLDLVGFSFNRNNLVFDKDNVFFPKSQQEVKVYVKTRSSK